MEKVLDELSNKGFIILDDLFDDLFICEIDYETDSVSWGYGNVSDRSSFPYGTKGRSKFWGSTLFETLSEYEIENKCSPKIFAMLRFIFQKVIKKEINLKTIQLNGQTIFQDGAAHTDDQLSPLTMIYFVNSKWEKDWGGELQFIEKGKPHEEIEKNIEFVPGRIVLFDARKLHRGLGPKVPDVLRKTIAFRISFKN